MLRSNSILWFTLKASQSGFFGARLSSVDHLASGTPSRSTWMGTGYARHLIPVMALFATVSSSPSCSRAPAPLSPVQIEWMANCFFQEYHNIFDASGARISITSLPSGELRSFWFDAHANPAAEFGGTFTDCAVKVTPIRLSHARFTGTLTGETFSWGIEGGLEFDGRAWHISTEQISTICNELE